MLPTKALNPTVGRDGGAQLNCNTTDCEQMRRNFLYPTIASAVTLVLHFVARLPWGLAALAAFVGLPLAGTVITIDDDLVGGWSNPDGKQGPDWLRARFWGRLFAGLAVSAVVTGLDGDWVPRRLVLLGGGAVAAATVSGLLLRRRAAEDADEPAGPAAGAS